jgi:hypothetical protein
MDGPVLNIVKPTKKAKAIGLYDVSDDDFHKEMLDDVAKSYTLQEFMAEKYPDEDWDKLDELRQDIGWTLPELAIHLYTTEVPNLYGPMNKMMREATSMDDIDEYWQSYMKILKNGLQKFAPFSTADTWRGVGDCSALDVLHVGDEGVLPSFTSTSTSMEAAAGFARGCTVLHFTGGGYDVSGYSDFPGEAELLMEEGRVYTIATAERMCEDDECFERFDCETSGPAAGVTGPTAAPDDEPTDESGLCATIADQVPEFQTEYCPLCNCCGPPPTPVEEDDGTCCSCCSVGGSCEHELCQDPTNIDDGIGYCDDAAANDPSIFSCDASLVQVLSKNQQKSTVIIAAACSMLMGMLFSAVAVSTCRRNRQHEYSGELDEEQPSLYTPLPE